MSAVRIEKCLCWSKNAYLENKIQNNYAKWKKPDQNTKKERAHAIWFHLYKILENAS